MKKDICPFLRKECIEHSCRLYAHITGKNPQNDAGMDHYDCSFAMLPILLIENTRESRFTTTAMYDFRNKVHESLTQFVDVIKGATDERQPVSHDSGDVPVLTDSVGGNGKPSPGSPDRLSDDALRP